GRGRRVRRPGESRSGAAARPLGACRGRRSRHPRTRRRPAGARLQPRPRSAPRHGPRLARQAGRVGPRPHGEGARLIPPEEIELVFGAGAKACGPRPVRKAPPAATSGIWHVATDSDSAVLKVVQLSEAGSLRWPAAPGSEHPYYWRREVEVYESGLVERLVGLCAPACRGIFERPDGSVALWLE